MIKQILFLLWAPFILADIYMHNMRGSNNRCDERTNDRLNANRLFDSQNNAAGGYSVPCQDTDLQCFNMKYFTESYLDIRFTTQHACGIQNQCEIIIQYACNMRNGQPTHSNGNTCTNTIPEIENASNIFGYHESYYSYQLCKTRRRNFNLYTGDQVLRGTTSIYTRQNPTGARYGFECPEERDYYPYWNYSEWIDIAVMTSNVSRCEYYKNHSNIICTNINNTMVNRLGATYDGTKESSFMWKLPKIPQFNCVLRIRYNISLPSDLDWFADKNNNNNFKTDPLVNVNNRYVRLALDTSQLPRTFQDRSYTFDIIQKEITEDIYNINVMGKRGNIAQVRNCIEYDFVPNNLTITENDYVHFQWVGSDFNALNNDGEGRGGTDRSNLVDITDYYGFNRIYNKSFIPTNLIDNFIYLFQLDENCYNLTELTILNKIKNTQDIRNCALLNNASVYFNSRIFKINISNNTHNTYKYMSTRNNNFSNRNQKGIIQILSSLQQMTVQTYANVSQLSLGYIAMITIAAMLIIFSIIYYNKYKKDIKYRIKTIKWNLATRI